MATNLKRRSFVSIVFAAIGIAGALIAKWKPELKRSIPASAKFLTRDGRLVEIDLDKVPFGKKAITKRELVRWIWKDQKL